MTSSRCHCGPFGVVPSRSHQTRITRPQNRLQLVAYPCERKSQKSLASETNDPKSLAPVTNEILSLANEILCLANDPVSGIAPDFDFDFCSAWPLGRWSCRYCAPFAVRYPRTRVRVNMAQRQPAVFSIWNTSPGATSRRDLPAQPPGARAFHQICEPVGGNVSIPLPFLLLQLR